MPGADQGNTKMVITIFNLPTITLGQGYRGTGIEGAIATVANFKQRICVDRLCPQRQYLADLGRLLFGGSGRHCAAGHFSGPAA